MKFWYVKEGDAWKIKRLEYRVTSKADYRPGRSCANPISVPNFSVTYPENPDRPDKLVAETPKLESDTVSFNCPHPVTGKLWET